MRDFMMHFTTHFTKHFTRYLKGGREERVGGLRTKFPSGKSSTHLAIQSLEHQIKFLMKALMEKKSVECYGEGFRDQKEFIDIIPCKNFVQDPAGDTEKDYLIRYPLLGKHTQREKAYYSKYLIGEIISFKNDTDTPQILHEKYFAMMFVTRNVLAADFQKSPQKKVLNHSESGRISRVVGRIVGRF